MLDLNSKKQVAWLSVASNTLLTTGKIFAGWFTGSISIISEAVHSGIDLLASAIATFSVHYADRPPDRDHPYGHEKIENISGVIEGLLIFIAALWIIYESVKKLIYGVELKCLGPGSLVMAFSAVMNILVATRLNRTARKTRSVALEADAAHLYTDVYTSVGVFLGLSVIYISRYLGLANLSWLDPAVAMGVAIIIIRVGYQITKKSFLPLMDTAARPEEEACILNAIKAFEQQGGDFHKLRTRHAGGTLHVDLHMGFPPGLTLERSHQLSHELKDRIEAELPGSQVLIHNEPSERIENLPASDHELKCIKEEMLQNLNVLEVRQLSAARYNNTLRVEASLALRPAVTLAESRAVNDELRRRINNIFPEVKDLVLSLQPGEGWQEAIHEDDRDHINKLLGEHEGHFADIHELRVISSGGRHWVRLRLGVPPTLSVADAHAIARHLGEDIKVLFAEGVEVDLQIEPCNEVCHLCQVNCPRRK